MEGGIASRGWIVIVCFIFVRFDVTKVNASLRNTIAQLKMK
jgi:hypothetical protein